ncbi:hypothetical protein VTL71DRAFT_5523 [Oculimacula yallundae]|uniref:Apple domain-containing protein n=1 Tax=Oculimacula yallundae TaxID=86028 RepID=A0ABR4C193_9HELO
MSSILGSLAFLSFAVSALASPVANEGPSNGAAAGILARAVCNDNLGRCFKPTGTASKDIASRAAATAFCSSFLSIPVVTSYIATSTPISSITVTTTLTASTETQTSVSTSEIEQTLTQTVTSTTKIPFVVLPPRALSTEAPPKCASAASPAQFTSACACLTVIPSTTYVTSTAPLATNTATNILSVTATSTTLTTTTAITGTKTETQIAVVTQISDNVECPAVSSPYIVGSKTFTTTCDRYSVGGRILTVLPSIMSFKGCIDRCISETSCVYGFWVSPSSEMWGEQEGNNCYLYDILATEELIVQGVSGFYLSQGV